MIILALINALHPFHQKHHEVADLSCLHLLGRQTCGKSIQPLLLGQYGKYCILIILISITGIDNTAFTERNLGIPSGEVKRKRSCLLMHVEYLKKFSRDHVLDPPVHTGIEFTSTDRIGMDKPFRQ